MAACSAASEKLQLQLLQGGLYWLPIQTNALLAHAHTANADVMSLRNRAQHISGLQGIS